MTCAISIGKVCRQELPIRAGDFGSDGGSSTAIIISISAKPAAVLSISLFIFSLPAIGQAEILFL